jgi:hypothetical protein
MKLGWSALAIAPVIKVTGFDGGDPIRPREPSMPFWGMDYRQFLLIKAVAFDVAEIDFDGVHVKRK